MGTKKTKVSNTKSVISMTKNGILSDTQLTKAINQESELFKEHYLWLEEHMSPGLFEDFEQDHILTIAHHLMGLHLQENFSQIRFPGSSIVLCLDSPDADLKILKNFSQFGIKNYQTYVSDCPPPHSKSKKPLRIAIIHFTEIEELEKIEEEVLDKTLKEEIFSSLRNLYPHLLEKEFEEILFSFNARFLRAMNKERLFHAIHMALRARTRDNLQYEVIYQKEWQQESKKGRDIPSLRIVLAWRNTPKYNFLFRLAKTIFRHHLIITRVNAAYTHPSGDSSILVMSLALHGQENKAAWEATDINDFLQEIATLKYFEDQDLIEKTFIETTLLRGNIGNFLRSTCSFVHQFLLHTDSNIYSIANIEEGLCRHPELTVQLCRAFEAKFHPEDHNLSNYEKERQKFLSLVEKLDTGNIVLDTRRQNILKASMNFIHYTMKTNFYRNNKSAHCFRLDPKYLDTAPYVRKEKFPELPYAIFYMKGRSFIAFHIRFKDISRGGLRTIMPYRIEQAAWERINVFSECYNLAYTQQKKNKDIPEGGSKGVIFIEPFDDLRVETQIYRNELQLAEIDEEEIKQIIKTFQNQQRLVYLYQSQRAYVHSLLTLVNCEDNGELKAKHVVDYFGRAEYIYLGPDENMHTSMIDWIADHAELVGYKPGKAFISSKPKCGINHKEYGVTSFGVNVYMHKVLEYLGIDPLQDPFTVKISGGPDGDVAGNQIYNLYRFYPKTAKLLAVTDVSGTIYDPQGLDLEEMVSLFRGEKPIACYPEEKLSNGGFLLDNQAKKDENAYQQLTLCWRKENGELKQDWLSGSDWHYIYRTNLHQVKTDIFIPAGGRPRTLNNENYYEYLDETGMPTSKAIVEGANLYLTADAREALEKLGVIIIKDSSANKGGVIASSFEVILGFVLSDEEFLERKEALMEACLNQIQTKASLEANLLLKSHALTQKSLIELSDILSKKINTYTYQILDHLQTIKLSSSKKNLLIRAFLDYYPLLLQEDFTDRLLKNIPDIHKKATIASHIASHMVYTNGLGWSPTIVDVLPLILKEIIEEP